MNRSLCPISIRTIVTSAICLQGLAFAWAASGETPQFKETFEEYEGPLNNYGGSGQSGSASPAKWMGSQQGTDAQTIAPQGDFGNVLSMEANGVGCFAGLRESFAQSGRFTISFDTSPSGGNAMYTFVRFGGSNVINEGREAGSIRIRFYSDGRIDFSTGDETNLQHVSIPAAQSHMNVSPTDFVMNKIRIEVLTPDAFDGSGEVKVALFVNDAQVALGGEGQAMCYTRKHGLAENFLSIGVQARESSDAKGLFDNFTVTAATEAENPFPNN